MINTTAKLLILSILWYSKSTSLPKLYPVLLLKLLCLNAIIIF